MKKLILSLVILFSTVAGLFACQFPYTCNAHHWDCTKSYLHFTTRAAFNNWVATHPDVDFQIVYTTAAVVDIVYENECTAVGEVCRDGNGVCDN